MEKYKLKIGICDDNSYVLRLKNWFCNMQGKRGIP